MKRGLALMLVLVVGTVGAVGAVAGESADAAGVVAASPAATPCVVDAAKVAAVTRAFYAKQAQQPLPLTMPQALCFRQAFVEALARQEGRVVGYKVGLYTQASRRTFGADGPAIGVMLRGMVRENVAQLPASLGFSPVAEADFVLVVGDEAINEASSREEFYRHLRGYAPFIELPDNHYPAGAPVSAGQLVALNVNARTSILGKELALDPTPAGLADLVNFSVAMTVEGPAGRKRLEGKAIETLGDPLEIAMFARDAVLREGRRLHAGDLISLGAVVAPHPPRAGERFEVRYQLGDDRPVIAVRFGP